MKMFRVFLLLFLSMAFMLLTGCRDKSAPTKPPEVLAPDTSSHEFEWQMEMLGDGNASVLNDVAIINDTLAYAVGAIYLKDSTGGWDSNAYNASKWNGKNWELKRIPFVGPCSAVLYPPIKAIWPFSNDTILLTNGGSIVSYNGVEAIMDCRMNSLLTGAINKIYAVNPEEVYTVGNNGSITHYFHGIWRKLESGTTQDIQDIWGIGDEQKQEKTLCAVSNKYHGGEKRILQILPNNQIAEFAWTPQRVAHSLWFSKDTPVFVCGSAFYRYENGQWKQVAELPAIFQNCVRGNNPNDVFVAGDFGIFAHWNGESWKVYEPLQLPQGNYEGLAVKGDFVVAAGWNGDRAVVVRGKRMAKRD